MKKRDLIRLTVLEKPHGRALLEANIHIEVLDRNVHVMNPVLIIIALQIELLDHFTELIDVFSIFSNTSGIPSKK